MVIVQQCPSKYVGMILVCHSQNILKGLIKVDQPFIPPCWTFAQASNKHYGIASLNLPLQIQLKHAPTAKLPYIWHYVVLKMLAYKCQTFVCQHFVFVWFVARFDKFVRLHTSPSKFKPMEWHHLRIIVLKKLK